MQGNKKNFCTRGDFVTAVQYKVAYISGKLYDMVITHKTRVIWNIIWSSYYLVYCVILYDNCDNCASDNLTELLIILC